MSDNNVVPLPTNNTRNKTVFGVVGVICAFVAIGAAEFVRRRKDSREDADTAA